MTAKFGSNFAVSNSLVANLLAKSPNVFILIATSVPVLNGYGLQAVIIFLLWQMYLMSPRLLATTNLFSLYRIKR